ncbi:MAG TPA: SDR family oxidoreductase [Thermoanaerobaculia bacterium]|jgi:3-oxoacyl-[acyl-carrier protein] reductase|nr:SDR family oxidoreductase [Thermoanaerobaculia bacterium]
MGALLMGEEPMGTILITGGSRGLGRAMVEALAAAPDARVAFTWNADEAAAREVAAATGARAFQLDLRDRTRPDDLVAEVESALGPLEALVNNGGLRRESLLAMTSDDDWEAVLDTNLGGLFRCCRAVLRGMMTRRRGAIVNVSSLSALHGVAGQGAYAASKAGILGLTRSLAREAGKRGVRVNAVVPGFVATDLTAGLPEAAIAHLRAGECLARGVAPADVAQAVRFLLSDAAAAITGQTLVVDAGASC